MRRFFFTILFMAGLTPAIAQHAKVQQDPGAAMNPLGLTINDCVNILNGLNALDRVGTGDNAGVPVYQFSSAALRLDIAHNIAVLNAAQNQAQQAQQRILLDILKTMPPTAAEPAVPAEGKPGKPARPASEIQPGTPEAVEYQRRTVELTERPCGVNVTPINAADLNLEKNPIPLGVLSLLDKIMRR